MNQKFTLTLAFILTASFLISQNLRTKKYHINSNSSKNHILYALKTVDFKDLDKKEKEIITKHFPINKHLIYTDTLFLYGKKVTYQDTIIIDSSFFNTFAIQKKLHTKTTGNSFVSKIHISNDSVFCTPLKIYSATHNQSFINYMIDFENVSKSKKVRFHEWSFNLTYIPLKYRPKPNDSIEHDITSNINLNIFTGLSLGSTKFIYTKKKISRLVHKKFTFGLLLGVSQTFLNIANTKYLDIDNVQKAVLTYGFGLNYNYNKFNVGAYIGRDIAIGQYAEDWYYNNKTWYGIGIGYTLFNY